MTFGQLIHVVAVLFISWYFRTADLAVSSPVNELVLVLDMVIQLSAVLIGWYFLDMLIQLSVCLVELVRLLDIMIQLSAV